MGIDVAQYRMRIGFFNLNFGMCISCVCIFDGVVSTLLHLCVGTLLLYLLLLLAGDIEINPGPGGVAKKCSICHINMRGLSGDRFRELKTDVSGNYDIITLSETLLSKNSKHDLSLAGYQPIIRHDGSDGGRGVAVYVCDNLGIKHRKDLECDTIEGIWLEIKGKSWKFLLYTCYRSPNSSVSFWSNLQEMMDSVKNSNIRNICIVGDLNAHPSTNHGKKLDEFANANNMKIMVNTPTRITDNSSTILDQFITNMDLKDIKVLPPIASCDHCLSRDIFRLLLLKKRHTIELSGVMIRQILITLDRN